MMDSPNAFRLNRHRSQHVGCCTKVSPVLVTSSSEVGSFWNSGNDERVKSNLPMVEMMKCFYVPEPMSDLV